HRLVPARERDRRARRQQPRVEQKADQRRRDVQFLQCRRRPEADLPADEPRPGAEPRAAQLTLTPHARDDARVITSAPLPKFVIHRDTLSHELRKQRGTSKHITLVPLFDLKFLNELAGWWCRNFKSAALAAVTGVPHLCSGSTS